MKCSAYYLRGNQGKHQPLGTVGDCLVMSSDEVYRLIDELKALYMGKAALDLLVELGPVAIGPLREYLLEGNPCKVFQPRLWAVEALARLGAKDVLLAYLLQEKEIPDPEECFGEGAVKSAAARFLAAWPEEKVRQSLVALSERRMLLGLIDALAELKVSEALPYFERALEDDFYRSAAENAFLQMEGMGIETLLHSALTPLLNFSLETPGSLERRRSALRLLNTIGISATQWQILRGLLHESDPEIFVEAAQLAEKVGSEEDRAIIARRLPDFLSSTPWHLRADIDEILLKLKNEAAGETRKDVSR
jgi:hypothetical protein